MGAKIFPIIGKLPKNFPIVGKNGVIFPTIGKKFPIIGKLGFCRRATGLAKTREGKRPAGEVTSE